jgi:hypothetical protein
VRNNSQYKADFVTVAAEFTEAKLATFTEERRKELRSPFLNSVRVFHGAWMSKNQEAKDAYDPTVWYQDFYNMLLLIMSDGNCFDTFNPTRQTTCSCMANMKSVITDAELRIICKYLAVGLWKADIHRTTHCGC